MVLAGVDLVVAVEMGGLAAKAVADFRRNLDAIRHVGGVEILPPRAAVKFRLLESQFTLGPGSISSAFEPLNRNESMSLCLIGFYDRLVPVRPTLL